MSYTFILNIIKKDNENHFSKFSWNFGYISTFKNFKSKPIISIVFY